MNKIIIIYNFYSIINFIYNKNYKIYKIYYNKKKNNKRLKKILFYFKYSKIKIKSKNFLKVKKNLKKNVYFIIKINFKVNLYKIDYLLNINKKKKIIILDKLNDVNNIGSILRTSNFFNVDLIIYISKKISNNFLNSKIFQISSGSMTPILIKKNIIKLIVYLKSKNFLIISLNENSKINFLKIKFLKNLVIIIGSESNSFKNKNILKESDLNISIPNKGGLKVLNASIAYSIFMFNILN